MRRRLPDDGEDALLLRQNVRRIEHGERAENEKVDRAAVDAKKSHPSCRTSDSFDTLPRRPSTFLVVYQKFRKNRKK
jgi:hypothetical protein